MLKVKWRGMVARLREFVHTAQWRGALPEQIKLDLEEKAITRKAEQQDAFIAAASKAAKQLYDGGAMVQIKDYTVFGCSVWLKKSN